MSDGKVLTKETKALIVQAVDDALQLPWYAEPFDGKLAKILLDFLDKKADKVIPDEVDALINAAITEAFNGQYDLAAEKAGTAINIVVDIPLIDEDTENALIVDSIRVIIRFILNWIEKRKEKRLP